MSEDSDCDDDASISISILVSRMVKSEEESDWSNHLRGKPSHSAWQWGNTLIVMFAGTDLLIMFTHNKCDNDDHSQDDKHSNGDGDDGGFGSRELGDAKFLHGENITNQIAPPYKWKMCT